MVARIYPDEKSRRQAEYQRAHAKVVAARLPDPILSLSDIDRAYIAGLIDGEGCIRVTKVGGRGPKSVQRPQYYYPEVGIAMTHRGVIEWLQTVLSSGTIKVNNHTRVREGWKPQVGIKFHGTRAKLLCEILFPYLKVKRPQAEIVLAFPMNGKSGAGNPIPTDIVQARKQAFEAMKILNKRGK